MQTARPSRGSYDQISTALARFVFRWSQDQRQTNLWNNQLVCSLPVETIVDCEDIRGLKVLQHMN